MNQLADRVRDRAPAKADDGYRTIRDLIDRQQHAIARALPDHLSPDRFARIVLTEVRTNPQLLTCSGDSLLGSVMLAAQLGLEPGGPLGLCYLVPRRRHGQWEAQFQLGYKGIIELAYRSERVASIEARAVYDADHFRFAYGLEEVLEHRPHLGADRGELTAVYALARFANGGHAWTVLSRADVEARRDQGAAGRDGPWATHFETMARKTAVRALEPYLPLSAEAARAIATDGAVATSLDTDLIDTVTVDTASEPPADTAGELPAADPPSADPTAEPGDGITPAAVLQMTIKELRPHLEAADLPVSGSRNEMRQRLIDHLRGDPPAASEEPDAAGDACPHDPDGQHFQGCGCDEDEDPIGDAGGEVAAWVAGLGADELARQMHGRDLEATGDEIHDRAELVAAILAEEAT